MFAGAINSYGPIAFNYGFALYFLTYRHGFVKRALVGEMFSGVSFLSRQQLMLIEYAFLVVAFALTYVVFRPLLFGDAAQCRLAAALLSAPALLPHIGYLFAQPDVTLYILLLLCLWVLLRASPLIAAGASCALCCVALLEHEAFCLMFYPGIAAILLHLCVRRRLPWIAGVLHVAVFAAAFVAIMHWGRMKVSPDGVLAEAQARTNAGIQQQVYDVMASTFAEQEALVRRMYTPGVIRVLIASVLLTLPYMVLLGRLLLGAMRAAGYGRGHRAALVVMFVSPLALCALGHDTTRWMGAMCLDATLFLLYFCLAQEGAASAHLLEWARGRTYLPWLAYLLAVGPYGATGLRSADQIVSAWYGP